MKKQFSLSLLLVLILDAGSLLGNHNAALFPSRKRKDFLGMNLPRMGNKWPYLKGSGWLSLQMPVRYTAYPAYGQITGMRPIQLSFDYSFDDHFSAGAYLGYFHSQIQDVYGTEFFRTTFSSQSGGFRLTLHFADLINSFVGTRINVRKWDLYTTAHMGWYTRNWVVGEKYRGTRDYANGSFSNIGIVAGVKYHPVQRIGIFAEGGIGPVSVLGFGITGRIIK
jgi:hypothetical protein